MVNSSGMNLLFFLGVLIPALVTVALFVVFCFCWYKMRIRNQILYKKHDPHGIEKLKDGEIYEPPPPPPPPFKESGLYFAEPMSHNNNNNSKGKAPTDNYEESPEPTEGFVNPTMYQAKPDSGFSDLGQIQCSMMENLQAQQQNSDIGRPHSQASDDSDDSGFRSSRSGQYIHSATNSSGTGHDQCHTIQNLSSCHDTAPLFKPIKIHPNDTGLPPSVSYVHRNSGKHKPLRHRSMLHPSHHNTTTEMESHSMNNIHTISQLQPQFQYHGSPHHVCNTNNHLCHMQHISKSNYDVHGGKLHSIDSHLRPLTSVGHIGPATSTYNQGHVPFLSHNGIYPERLGSQPNSIGYSSDFNSLGQDQYFGHNNGLTSNLKPIKRDLSCHIPLTSISVGQKTPISTHIPPFSESHYNPQTSAYNPQTSAYNPLTSGYNPLTRAYNPLTSAYNPQTSAYNPQTSAYFSGGGLQKISEPLPMSTQSPMELTVTTAMVHRPYIEELADPSLYSVV